MYTQCLGHAYTSAKLMFFFDSGNKRFTFFFDFFANALLRATYTPFFATLGILPIFFIRNARRLDKFHLGMPRLGMPRLGPRLRRLPKAFCRRLWARAAHWPPRERKPARKLS